MKHLVVPIETSQNTYRNIQEHYMQHFQMS